MQYRTRYQRRYALPSQSHLLGALPLFSLPGGEIIFLRPRETIVPQIERDDEEILKIIGIILMSGRLE